MKRIGTQNPPHKNTFVCLFVFSLPIISLKPSANLKKKVQNHVGLVKKNSVTFNKSTLKSPEKSKGLFCGEPFHQTLLV